MDVCAELRELFDTLTPAARTDLYNEIEGRISFLQAVNATLLASIAATEDHKCDGAHTIADWIASTGRHHSPHAHRIAEVAETIEDLPHIRQTFAAGELSFDQTYELCRFVTADTDEAWAARAPAISANGLRRHAQKHRPKKDDDPDPEPRPNRLDIEHDRDGRGGRISGRFDTAALASIEAALQRQADRYAPDPETAKALSRRERMACALRDLVTAAKPSTWADRATMVVHASLDTLAGLDDRDVEVDLPFPAWLCAAEARRLAEWARLEVSLDDPTGRPIGIGRASRLWPPQVYRRIADRDGTCRWPGCNNTIGLQVHHEPPFPRGPTDTHHGMLLCCRHHDNRTTKGFTITGNPEDELHFWRLDGTLIGTSRPPLKPDQQTLHDYD